jgi:hypothetical protein
MFIKVQLFLLAIFAVIYLIGDHARLHVTSPDGIAPAQPIILVFDQPPNRASVETSFRLAGPDGQVKGNFSWSGRAVAFLPDHSLQPAKTYTLTLASARDIQGHPLAATVRRKYKTQPVQFFFRALDGSLELYNTATHRSRLVLGSMVDYAVAGQSALATTVNGLEWVVIEPSGSITVKHLGEGRSYSHAGLCASGQEALAEESDIRSDGLLGNTRLVSFDLSTGTRTILLAPGTFDMLAGAICSARSDQFIYRDAAGSVDLTRLSQLAPVSLGAYATLYGFGPNDSSYLVGSLDADRSPPTRAVLSLSPQGRQSLGVGNASDPDYSPDGSVYVLAAGLDDYGLDIYMGGQRRQLTTGAPEASDERPHFSPDGRSLTFERIDESTTDPNRPLDANGRYIDGEIWLARLQTGEWASGSVTFTDLGLRGSDVSWVP